ncbi:hypothetical protein FRC10_007376 [Ceratobasidium sp. 414]|nr:hypothetical protein FRC10_007376 [Ceratobasidium sp. 414]
MDQNSFRSMLNASAASASNVSKSKAYNRGSLLASGSSQANLRYLTTMCTRKPEPSTATFKPRKVNKPTDSKYRDRASERRGGVNEYAEVEGILQDFEKRTAGEDKDAVEEQRKYLGGDATHTVLVKGLDFALLEQNRARDEAREDLDDDLESAFLGKPTTTDIAPTTSDPPTDGTKKRTRAELLAELQRSRGANADSSQNAIKVPTREEELEALERAKQAGKFKPIGASSFAPVEKKKKKKKKVLTNGDAKVEPAAAKDNKGKEKDRRRDEGTGAQPQVPEGSSKQITSPQTKQLLPNETIPAEQSPAPAPPDSALVPTSAPHHLEEDVEDIDPFAEAGDYEPDYGDDSDAEGEKSPKETAQPPSSAATKRNWFNEPEPEPVALPVKPPNPPPQNPVETEEPDPLKPMRLEGLSSSAIPSISEFLAIDKEEEEREKKRARKEKKKKGGGVSITVFDSSSHHLVTALGNMSEISGRYVLFHTSECSSVLPLVALRALKILHGVVLCDFRETTRKQGPNYERLFKANSLAQFPALITPEGSAMTEMTAIILYLQDRHAKGTFWDIHGLTPLQLAAFYRWLVSIPANLYSALTIGKFPSRFVRIPADGGVDQQPVGSWIATAAHARRAEMWATMKLNVSESLGDGRFVLGILHCTFLDVLLALIAHFMRHAGDDSAWLPKACSKLFKSAMATLEIDVVRDTFTESRFT